MPLPWFASASNSSGPEQEKTGRAAVVAPMAAEGFINTDVDGKAQWLSHLKGGTGEQNEISDVQVMVDGNARIATGAWTGKGGESDGSKVDRHQRWTDGMGEDAGW